MHCCFKKVLTKVLALSVFIGIVTTASGCVGPESIDDKSRVDSPQSQEAVLLAADDHGAIIREAVKEDVMTGLNRQGKKTWSQSGHEGLAVCVSQCPKAIVSGSLDAMGSPVVATPKIGYHGVDLARLPKAFKVFVPVSIDGEVLVVTADKSGKTTARWWKNGAHGAAVSLESANIFWIPGQGSSGILMTQKGDKAFAHIVSRAGKIGSPIQTNGAGSGCTDTDGSWILPMENGVVVHRLQEKKKNLQLKRFSPEDLGACVIGSRGFVVTSLGVDANGVKEHRYSRLQYYGPQGNLIRKRTENIESVPVVSPDGSMIARRSGSAVVVETIDGHTKKTYDGKIAAVFTPSGQLALMTPKGKVTWERP
ncbi:MAG: hypothetical protein E6788_01715 [Propionibacterium sp.]|nr:hypothetical protein [Propionibacterium sp.]